MNPTELAIHRRNTKAFIDVKPTTIALVPVAERQRTAGGGYKDVPGAPRVPQIFRIIELGMTATPPVITTQDGKAREVDFWLLGEWNAEIAVDDSWTEGTRVWEVGEIIRTNEYETRAVVVERGR